MPKYALPVEWNPPRRGEVRGQAWARRHTVMHPQNPAETALQTAKSDRNQTATTEADLIRLGRQRAEFAQRIRTLEIDLSRARTVIEVQGKCSALLEELATDSARTKGDATK